MAGIAESLADYHTYYGDADLINTGIGPLSKCNKRRYSACGATILG
jgi:hypothetical protein